MSRHNQLIILYILPLLAVTVSIITKTSYLGSMIFFWGVPSLLLTIWAPKKSLKVLIYALIGTVFLITLDVIFYATKQWDTVSMFNNRFLGLVSWEDFPYFFLWAYFPVIFWEHFYEGGTRDYLWSKRMTRITGVFVLFLVVIIFAWAWAPALIQVPYFYLFATIFLIIIPLTLEVKSHPKMGLKFLRIGAYFAYIGILYELTGLYLGLWSYPSNQFLGWIEVVGLRFPIEELFAWIVLGVAGILTWYEYFDDDNR